MKQAEELALQMKQLADFACQTNIVGGSIFRPSSLLFPVKIILGKLERYPDKARINFAKDAARNEIHEHIRRLRESQGKKMGFNTEQAIIEYVERFFDIVAHFYDSEPNRVLNEKRDLVNVYQAYIRDAYGRKRREKETLVPTSDDTEQLPGLDDDSDEAMSTP